MKYIREKKVHFGDGYLDVDLFEMTDGKDPPLKRAKRKKVSPPHIIEANDRRSRNHLRQLFMHNFGAGDIYMTCTYSGEPPTLEEAQRHQQNFIARLKRLYARHGVEFRAIYVTEGGNEKPDGSCTRVHHHLVIPGGVPREEIERCWNDRQNGSGKTRRGYCNTSVIQPDTEERGCERIAEYLAKSRTKNLGSGTRRWNCTRNIKRPIETVTDNRFSRRRTEELLNAFDIKNAVKLEAWEDLRRLLEKRYDKELTDVICSVNPVDGHVYLSARFRRQQACFIKQRK